MVGAAQLSDINMHHLRDYVSVVSQHSNLFDASIAENMWYGSTAVSDVDVCRAAKEANVHKCLPMGYDTLVGENAGLISGGQEGSGCRLHEYGPRTCSFLMSTRAHWISGCLTSIKNNSHFRLWPRPRLTSTIAFIS